METDRVVPEHISKVVSKFSSVKDAKQSYQLLLEYALNLPAFPDAWKTAENRVMGCSSQAWVHASLSTDGSVSFSATSDSELTKGLGGVLVACLSGLTPQQVIDLDPANFIPKLGLGPAVLAPSRANGFANMLEAMKRRARMLVDDLPRFPSLLITADDLVPQGPFAEAQAQYLQPQPQQVEKLAKVLAEKKIGVVAHFYMDPQVQGVLSSAAESWPHIHISDSLVMADAAVKMAKEGCTAVAVLGVDFMSENVRAILDEAGYQDVKVYRMSGESIGCSLAEAAESEQYMAYLTEAAGTPRSMHVVYINTSLRTKAQADALVPTITCTSSNVVQTILQGFAQVPDLTVWYGPDTYMGRNLAQLFTQLADMPDEEIKQLHPDHNQATIRSLLPRLKHFNDGTCIVHHVFGGEVCELVKKGYNDAYLTAHFEVPGEMFTLAMQAKARGMGVVGSTSNILDFIAGKVSAALEQPFGEKLQFVLGTEAGMITSIVRKVQGMLHSAGRKDVEVQIVFPVAPQAISTAKQSRGEGVPAVELPGGLAVVPGPAMGEGCSLEGGCAACPYMKMNTLAALQMVCERVGTPAGEAMLEAYKPKPYEEKIGGKSVAQAGCVPILHMRHFTKEKCLSQQLVEDIETRYERA